ncbi:15387_t:CDS:2 [Funneliformis mosseae]|uniref:15387_t:CDS:1 n=1 Tax=Funneliformis mosseae TaxID=27381 RepID=A0A9N8V278_FUNMO|nr:15387_t:CDS:2 [Funneliformis mosseae]
MTGISNWFEFQWPVEGEFSGFVRGRALPNFGIWNDFSLSTICKSMKAELNRLTKDNIKEELERRSLFYDEKENQQELIAILRENIACETKNKIAGKKGN